MSSTISMRSTSHRHAGPVHPAAERIVERHAVESTSDAAHAARADAAQRHALRGRVRRQAAGAPEQAERRHLAQHVVGHDRGDRRICSLSMTLTLAGTSASRCSVRVGVTDTDSNRVAGASSTVERRRRPAAILRRSRCAHRTMVAPAGTEPNENRPSGPVTVCCSAPEGPRAMTAAPAHDAAGRIGDDAGHPGLRRRRERRAPGRPGGGAVRMTANDTA